MARGTPLRLVPATWSLLTVAGVFVNGGTGSSQAQSDRPETVKPHPHAPVELDSRPVVSRYRISVVRPRRVLIDPAGQIFVADWGADAVLRIDSEGRASVFADGIVQPSGLARDVGGNLYVTSHAEGMTKSGSVIRISPNGRRTVFAEGLSGPTGLAFDAAGRLYVANYGDESVVRIAADGTTTTIAEGVPGPSAVAVDAAGALFVASLPTGAVYRVSPMGELSVVARNLPSPTDLAFDPQGPLVVASTDGTDLAAIDPDGTVKSYATVPKGTIAQTFDADGNLVLANWDLRLLMKVTSNLSIPCPHCGKRIPVRLRTQPETPYAAPATRPAL